MKTDTQTQTIGDYYEELYATMRLILTIFTMYSP